MDEEIQKLTDGISGEEREELHKAIINAYPDRAGLQRAIDFKLNENLDAIAGNGKHGDVVYELIKWATSEGKLEDLIVALYNNKPGNKQLKAIQQKLYPSVSKPDEKLNKKPSWNEYIPLREFSFTLFTSLGITALIAVMRLSGIFQASEFWFFDRMMRLQLPSKSYDERLLLIEITPEDRNKYGTGQVNSLPDKTIRELLQKLLDLKPRVIGLDLYREFPTQDRKLKELLETESRLLVVCKVPDAMSRSPGTSPPPEVLKKPERIGFSDLLSDITINHVVRRQLLQMDTKNNESTCRTRKGIMDSFSFKLAQHYLTKEKKQYAKNESGNLASGNIILQRLHSWTTGGYQSEDSEGYQVLLNYRRVCINNYSPLPYCSIHKIGEIRNVSETLEKSLNKELIEDKIVLIGTNLDGNDSRSLTPFEEPPLSGLIMQAQQVSQLVSAVLDRRPLLKVWSIWLEIIWIFAWSLLGGSIAYFCPSKRYLIGFGVIAFSGLCFVCLFFFMPPIKRWVPFVPPALTLLGTGGVVVYIKFKTQKHS